MKSAIKWSFKANNSFDQRKTEGTNIRKKFPDRIPVIVENGSPNQLPDLDKKKYLVPYDLTVAQFYYIIRKRVNLRAETTLFCFVNNTIPAASLTMGELYEAHHEEDMFMYFAYADHDPFGTD